EFRLQPARLGAKAHFHPQLPIDEQAARASPVAQPEGGTPALVVNAEIATIVLGVPLPDDTRRLPWMLPYSIAWDWGRPTAERGLDHGSPLRVATRSSRSIRQTASPWRGCGPPPRATTSASSLVLSRRLRRGR